MPKPETSIGRGIDREPSGAVACAFVADPSPLRPGGSSDPGRTLFPAIDAAESRVAITVDGRSATFADLAALAIRLRTEIEPGARVAVLAGRTLDAAAAVVAAIHAGATVVPVNPTATPRELTYLLEDCRPELIVLGADSEPPGGLTVPALVIDANRSPAVPVAASSPATTATPRHQVVPLDGGAAVIMYTSGTTGPPKGAVLSRAALAANLDALAATWAWTAHDRLVHALPLYHVHGLILGVLGPVRLGGQVVHTGRFDPATTAAALDEGATVHFGVPTIYARLADAADADPALARSLANARLLVSGSAGLPRSVHERIRVLTGQAIVERYGMTETMITAAVPAGVTDRIGTVGPALPGVEISVVGDDGHDVAADDQTLGEVRVRTPSMFSGYFGRPEQTADSFVDGWFCTGDVATRATDGFLRIVGRNSTDIIKSGGFKIGAGEIEDALLEHPAVAEAAVKGWPDDDLGERVCAWIVTQPDAVTTGDALAMHLADVLVAHKRPRHIIFVDELPRNAMGKVQKSLLPAPAPDA